MNEKQKYVNKLINEKSPYLLQHAHNPVNWFPWGDEAFTKAKAEDKPIFLSIGYSTCHWCHVMERESFEDEEVARVLNRNFISIKVDREERPDIDHIYMTVCQALTGHGGWPLTIIMTPDKKPFFAATYIPKTERGGMYGGLQLLPRITELWQNDREALLTSSQKVSDWVKESDRIAPGEISQQTFDEAFNYLLRSFDDTYGGFGDAPKFPSPHNLLFLMRYYVMNKNKSALDMVEGTLQSMYEGGIYDHIGFGFSRYSTDRQWLVPHFEKMLYDNALLALVYLEAYQLTGKKLYGRIAREIFTYVLQDMTSPVGSFFSAEDADSEGVEGKYYLWTVDETESILGKQDANLYCTTYNISHRGNFEGKNIPNLIKTGIDELERQGLEPLREKLLTERDKRIHPYKDDKILTGWNGLMITALAVGARIFDDNNYLNAARKAADFILNNMIRADGRLLARYREGQALYPAYAADYAYFIWGLIELYQAGLDSKYLKMALKLNGDLIELFWDKERGGVFLYGKDSEQLLTRPRETYDGAMPSSNSVTAFNLLRLARITSDEKLQALADQQLETFGGNVNEIPSAHTFFLIAAMGNLNPGRDIIITGNLDDDMTKQMLKEVNKKYLPDTLVIFKDNKNKDDLVDNIPFLKDIKMINNQTTAYVCSNYTCQEPVTELNDLINKLK